MKYGQELKEQVLATKKRMQDAIDRRAERIANWQTDEDDCFISQHIEEDAIRECNLQLKILENGGTQDWEVVLDENGKEVRVHSFTNKWGKDSWVGNGIFASSFNALLKKTGWKTATIKVPVWTKYQANGTGMMGVYCGRTEVVRWHTNMATGEYVGYPD